MAHLVVGPDEHGVVRHGLAVAGGAPVLRGAVAEGPALVAGLAGDAVVHVPFSDHLLGDSTEDAAAWFAAVAAAGHPVTVTLHDLPHAGDGPQRYARRAATYRAVATAAAGVVVNSVHEASLLDAVLLDGVGALVRPRAVVPLPVDPPAPGPRPAPRHEVAVLGFVYPGKGHAEVLEVLPAGVPLVALGRVADGHDDLLAVLRSAAGGRFAVTGFLPDAGLDARLRGAGVPVAPHRGISASGSIGSWLSAGRRPLVPDEAWTAELEARCPGALWRYGDTASLGAAVAQALAEPGRTWLGPDVVLGPSTGEVVARYAELLAAVGGPGWS
ncbi:hypothetical protein [Rhodococcus aerolatus]